MAIRIKKPRAHELAKEIAALTGETQVEAVTKALEERLAKLNVEALRKG